MSWDNLSMADRAAYIKLGLDSGITDLKVIRDTYNKYAEGGPLNPYSAGSLVDAIYKNSKGEEYLGKPSHHYDFTISEEEANRLGYYPDERGHRDDRVKKPAHPTHPSRGKWNSFEEFELTDRGMENPNYTLFGLNDGGQDPQAVMTYRGGVVLPEITVTPKKRYIHNPYDNTNIYAGGGPKENKVLSTGNSYVDAALGFVPIVGSAMEIEDAVRKPSLRNIGSAAFSVGTDLLGLSLLRGGVKAYRLARAAERAHNEFKAISTKNNVSKAYKTLGTPNLNPKKYEAAKKTLLNSGAKRAFEEANKADNAMIHYNLYELPFIDKNLNIAGFVGGMVQDSGQFINSLNNNR